MHSAITNYCPLTLPPSPNCSPPTSYALSVGSSVTCVCSYGYSGVPSTGCLAYNGTCGQWSAYSSTCIRMAYLRCCVKRMFECNRWRAIQWCSTAIVCCSDLELLLGDTADCAGERSGAELVLAEPRRVGVVHVRFGLLGQSGEHVYGVFSDGRRVVSGERQLHAYATDCARAKHLLASSGVSGASMATTAASHVVRTEITNYCQVSSAPAVPANAASPVYVTTVNGVTTYSCNAGYSGSVSITCLPGSASTGVWSAISGSCTGSYL